MRRCQRADSVASCCSTTRNARTGPPSTKTSATGPDRREAAASTPAPTSPATAQASWRTRKPVTSSGECTRSRRTASASVTPKARAACSPTARASGAITWPNDAADMTAPRRRADAPPGHVGRQPVDQRPAPEPAQLAEHERRPDEQRERHQGRRLRRSFVEHPLLLGQREQPPGPHPARHHRGDAGDHHQLAPGVA